MAQLVRKRKAAVSLATKMVEELVAENPYQLRGVTSIEGAERALGPRLSQARKAFHDRVTQERRGEKLFDNALQAALDAAVDPAPARGIAPKVIEGAASTRASGDSGSSYRDAAPEPEIKLKPSRLLPPPSALARMRNQLLFAAAWIVAVIRFAGPIRHHGVSRLALMQGLLGTMAVLPIALGVLLLILPKR